MYDLPRPGRFVVDPTTAVRLNVSGLSRVSRGCGQAMMRSVRFVLRYWFVQEHAFFPELEGRDESPTAAIIDSQSVKTGAEAREMIGGRKRHLVPDTLGLMLRIEVHSASVQDRDCAALVLDRITRRVPFLERIFADAGYQGPRVAAAAPRPVEIVKRTDTPSPGPASTAASPAMSSAPLTPSEPSARSP